MKMKYRDIWIGLSIFGLIFILTQSYLAKPRAFGNLLLDGLLPILVVLTFLTILKIKRNTVLLIFGIFYLLLVFITFFTNLFPKQYGTFFFLFASYLFVDWYNYLKFKKNITLELQKDKSVIALGVFASTFIFGLITEYVNLPFMIWSYNTPLPSLKVFGIPAIIATFGWTPWTLVILSIFYHFVLLAAIREVSAKEYETK